ncbi:amidohydrolase family protein [Actinomadura madurae]|uniref:amidohydrolase family protein n=2 Tax=Actinomadura madurae TaxID=1993 RepID=UPI002026CBEC|nr:amidohydrolase family protein [Actinomadura madurae]URM94606.1 amidohydrolase family protein [Actinomadura madurae]
MARQFHPTGGGIEQAITIEEALHSYTSTPAWQDHAEHWKGQLRPGHVGDMTILNGDMLNAKTAEEITSLDVAGTIMGGEVVYDASTTTARCGAAYRHQASAACGTKGVTCCRQANERRLAHTTA